LSEEEIANAAAKVVPPSNMVRLSRTRRSGIDLSRVMTGQEFSQPAEESMAIPCWTWRRRPAAQQCPARRVPQYPIIPRISSVDQGLRRRCDLQSTPAV